MTYLHVCFIDQSYINKLVKIIYLTNHNDNRYLPIYKINYLDSNVKL